MTHPTQAPSAAAHWDEVYRTKAADQVSWYQPATDASLRLVTTSPVTAGNDDESGGHRSVIDVGAGASALVDGLLGAGNRDVTALDVSQEALAVTRRRLGDRADRVSFVVSDLLAWRPDRSYHTWHDRAVLHFLTTPADRTRYVRLAADAVPPGGVVILAGFAPDGPTHCSGLPTAQRSAEQLADEFADHFTPRAHRERDTPHPLRRRAGLHLGPATTDRSRRGIARSARPTTTSTHARPPLDGTS